MYTRRDELRRIAMQVKSNFEFERFFLYGFVVFREKNELVVESKEIESIIDQLCFDAAEQICRCNYDSYVWSINNCWKKINFIFQEIFQNLFYKIVKVM